VPARRLGCAADRVSLEETKIEVVLKQRNTGREMKVAVWAEAGEPFVKRITIHPLGEGGEGPD
jgi:hypothetical protein